MNKLVICVLIPLLLFLTGVYAFAEGAAPSNLPISVTWEKLTGAGSRKWNQANCAADGSILLASAETRFCVSFDAGKTWKIKSVTPEVYLNFSSVSANGKLIFVGGERSVYASADGGKNWVKNIVEGSHSLSGLNANDDGTVLYGFDFDFDFDNSENTTKAIFKSIDSGQTWHKLDLSAQGKYLAATCDRTGSLLFAAFWANGSGIEMRLSRDGGLTWEGFNTLAPNGWENIYCSADGSCFFATAGNVIFYSKDFGKNWRQAEVPGIEYFNSICSSADGRVVAVSEHKGYIWLSFDGGITWQAQKNMDSQYWINVAVNASGKQMLACSDGYIWLGKYE